jgi:hypothetical protein
VLYAIDKYRQQLEQQGGVKPATFAADVVALCDSLSTAVGTQEGQEHLQACAGAAQLLCAWAQELLQQGQEGLSMQDLCSLANTLRGMLKALGSHDSVLPLARAIAARTAACIKQDSNPPTVRAWRDLLYGLTKAGLAVNTDLSASPGGVKEHSADLQYLLDQGAQQLPVLLGSNGAMGKDVSLTLLAYAYAGYTGDLGPVTHALASNPEGCLHDAKPQALANILWALGKLCSMMQQKHQQLDIQPTAYNHKVFSYVLGELHRQLAEAKPQEVSNAVHGCALVAHVEGALQLLDCVCQESYVMAKWNPQDWSSTVWAAAKLGCVEQGSVLLTKLAAQPQVMQRANLQHWNSTLWAAATMYESAALQEQDNLARELQHSGQLLMGALLQHCQMFENAKSQEWSNTIWAAAKLGCVEQGSLLLTRLAGQPQVMAAANPQHWSCTIWAAAKLGCVEQGSVLLTRLAAQPQVMTHANPTNWSNTLWAAATMYESAALQDQDNLARELQHSGQLLMGALLQHCQMFNNAKPQEWSNTIWAAAKLGCGEQGSVLLGILAEQPQVMAGAKPQEWSNTIWAAAKLGCGQQGSVLLATLVGQPQVLTHANPQNWSNTLWATATMYESAALQDQDNLARGLKQTGQLLMRALLQQCQMFDNAVSQDWYSTLWAAAKLGCVEQGSVLLDRLAGQLQVMQQAKPQGWSNTVWAAGTLYQTAVDARTSAAFIDKLQKGGHLLLQACAFSPAALEGANSQSWSNTLWAAAVLHWYDQRLFSLGAAALAAMPPAHLAPQVFSNVMYACAMCAHWDDKVQQLLGQVEAYDLAAFTGQDLANTVYAWAVLSCVMTTSQHQGVWISAAKPLLKEAARRDVSSFSRESFGQLYTAHMCAEYLGIPGLPAGAVLEAARAVGWSFTEPIISAGQRQVASVLKQLDYTTELEMRSPDGVMSTDVGVTVRPGGSSCCMAVEFDGPSHFVADHSNITSPTSNRKAATVDRLDGPTRLRNAFLQQRFPGGVVCIPCETWKAAKRAGRQVKYLRALMGAALKTKVRVAFILECLGASCSMCQLLHMGARFPGSSVNTSQVQVCLSTAKRYSPFSLLLPGAVPWQSAGRAQKQHVQRHQGGLSKGHGYSTTQVTRSCQ